MAKRDKTPDIANLLGGKARAEEQAPAPESKPGLQSKPTPQAGLPAGWTRATFIVRKDDLEQLKALAYYQRRPLKDILEEALARYLRTEETSKALEVYLRRRE